MKRLFLLITTIAAFTLSGLLIYNRQTDAISAGDWKAGNIVSDSNFYNSNSMSVAEIQSFLNSLVPSCDTWGAKAHETIPGKTRAQVGVEYNNPPPYICVKDYYENPTTHETNFNSTATIPTGAQSAAQIVYNAAIDYNINPRVLLVTIKKEAANNLLQDEWPWAGQYRTATGYACPDTAPCDSQYYGFYNQVRNMARQFRLYADYPDNYRRKAGGTYFIQYHPSTACSGANVFMENQATAGLYNYTPYQPNAIALANMPGTGNSCSSYGNRNFWYIWSGWFGNPQGFLIQGSIKVRYDTLSGPQTLGAALYNERSNGDLTWWQCFENGCIIGNRITGYWESKGSIRVKWGELGYQDGVLGMPTSGEIYNSTYDSWEQNYEKGKIISYSSGISKFVIKGSIHKTYESYAKDTLYLPSGDEKTDGRGNWWQKFGDNAAIVGNGFTGYWESKGSIRVKWGELGYQDGVLGMPTGREINTADGCYSQEYKNGRISGCRGIYTYELN